MTETFDREAIQRVRAFLNRNERGEQMVDWEAAAAFLAHYDAMAEALREARCCDLPPDVFYGIDTVLSAYPSPKEG